jgi:hypothetical protein
VRPRLGPPQLRAPPSQPRAASRPSARASRAVSRARESGARPGSAAAGLTSQLKRRSKMTPRPMSRAASMLGLFCPGAAPGGVSGRPGATSSAARAVQAPHAACLTDRPKLDFLVHTAGREHAARARVEVERACRAVVRLQRVSGRASQGERAREAARSRWWAGRSRVRALRRGACSVKTAFLSCRASKYLTTPSSELATK